MLIEELSIAIEPDGDRFHAFCPTLKGLHVSGATEEEALDNAKVAIICYLYSMVTHGDTLMRGSMNDKLWWVIYGSAQLLWVAAILTESWALGAAAFLVAIGLGADIWYKYRRKA